jgi:hypothetical protein
MLRPYLQVFTIAILSLVVLCGFSDGYKRETRKPKSGPFYLYYCFAGLGFNMGSMEPTLQVWGTKFLYTYEQNSYYGQRDKQPDTILQGNLKQASIDSIIELVKDMKDTSFFESNPCIMSGGIHNMSIAIGEDTVGYEMMNTMDTTVLKVIKILNPYLPGDKKIWADEDLIKAERDCWKYLMEDSKEEKKKGR